MCGAWLIIPDLLLYLRTRTELIFCCQLHSPYNSQLVSKQLLYSVFRCKLKEYEWYWHSFGNFGKEYSVFPTVYYDTYSSECKNSRLQASIIELPRISFSARFYKNIHTNPRSKEVLHSYSETVFVISVDLNLYSILTNKFIYRCYQREFLLCKYCFRPFR